MRFPPLRRICCLVLFSSLLAAASGQGPALRTFTKAPQSFEPNRGQAAEAFDFTSHGPGYSLSLSADAAYLHLFSAARPNRTKQSSALSLKLVGANPKAHGDGLDRQPGKSNYFVGNKSNQWLTDVLQFGRVEYRDVYPGIDMAYYGTNERLEYDFILGPHADARRIRFAVDGADRIRIDSEGDLVLTVGSAEIRERKPLIYQKTANGQRIVRGRYAALEGNQIGFVLEKYDQSKALVIDPVLVFSTYFGGSGSDYGNAIAVDSEGNSYIAGQTGSANLPGIDIGKPGFTGSDTAAFVAKVSPAGALLSTTILAGADDAAEAGAVALDTNGNIYLCGYTSSPSFPTVNPNMAYQGGGDAFVLELNNAGNSLIYSTYLGGSGLDYADGIAVDSEGNILVGGATTSENFPVVNAAQSNRAGGYNPWAAKIAPGGSNLVYSTYWGGSATDYANGLAIDSTGDLILFGDESSMDFPVTKNALQPNYCAPASGPAVSTVHGWVAEFSPVGVPIYSTYICGTVTYYTINGTTYPTYDVVRSGTVDTSGNAIITGTTASLSFPTMNPVQADYGGGSASAFLTKLSPTGTLLYSTYLGGPATTSGLGVAVDPQDNLYVAGATSASLPTVNPTQSSYGGGNTDAFLMKLNAAGSNILFSTYLGGSGDDQANGLAVDSFGNAYAVGTTASKDFPTASALQATYGGGAYDAFLAAFATTSAIKPTVSVTPSTLSITTAQALSVAVAVSGGNGNPTPSGSVILTSGSYASAATALSAGSATIGIPAGSLSAGSDTLTALYLPDTSGSSTYNSATGVSAAVTVTQATPAQTPTVTVTLSALNITNAQALSVTVAVSGGSGNPVPTGSVTVTSGNYYVSVGNTLTSGSVTISIPAGSLAVGSDTVTASYGGDANYKPATGTATVTVTSATPPGFTLSATAVTLSPGATTADTSTITVTPSGGFTGSVTLTPAITSSPSGAANPPTLSFGTTTPVSITGASAGTATLTISTTAATTAAALSYPKRIGFPWYATGGVALACMLLFGIPARRRSWRTMLGMLILLTCLTCGIVSCGGGSSSGTSNAGTTAGTYTVTVTGTSGTITETCTVALTVQ
jgi:hypothetical protein